MKNASTAAALGLALLASSACGRHGSASEPPAFEGAKYSARELAADSDTCRNLSSVEKVRAVECWHIWRPTADRATTQDAAKRGEPGPGMPTEVLHWIWGDPKEVNATSTFSGRSEQWVYGDGKYVYVEHGIVTAVQTSK